MINVVETVLLNFSNLYDVVSDLSLVIFGSINNPVYACKNTINQENRH